MKWELIHPSESPARTGQGEIALVPLREADPYTGVSVSAYNFTVSTMAKLGFSFVKAEGKADAHFFLLEIASYKAGIYSVRYQDDSVFFVREGVGIRIGVACWNASFSASSNLAMVAASVAVKGAESQFEVKALGQDADVAVGFFADVNKFSGFNPDAMRAIGKASEQVVDWYVAHPNLEPEHMQVASLGVGVPGKIAAGLSMQFANEQVYRQHNLNTALGLLIKRGNDEEKRHFHPVVVRAGYAAYGLDTDSAVPTQKNRDQAERILRLGR